MQGWGRRFVQCHDVPPSGEPRVSRVGLSDGDSEPTTAVLSWSSQSTAANQLTVEKANQELATYDPRRLTGVSVYRENDCEFSVGDRIQFTAPDKSLGVANRDLAVVEAIYPYGRLSARLDNSRQIEFNAGEHRHFDHGYAVTSHNSQGLTAERVLVHADTSVHPDLLNCRLGYVSISHASHQATLFA
jgi:ATP-dependent exoDNAse (exonuclease V) alpha subunit